MSRAAATAICARRPDSAMVESAEPGAVVEPEPRWTWSEEVEEDEDDDEGVLPVRVHL